MLTKKERIELKNIANTLPPEPSNVRERVSIMGGELLRLNPIAMDEKGKPIIRSRQYTVEQFKPVNHYKKMLQAYEKNGIEAIDQYVDGVIERFKEQEKEKEVKDAV